MKKRKVKEKLKKSSILILVIGISILIVSLFFVLKVILKSSDNAILDNNELELPQEEKEEIYELSLIMAGDNLIHNSVYQDANKNTGYNGYDFKPMYTYLKEIVSGYDLAYYNQETILGGSEIGLSTYPCFNSPYEVGDAMIDAGFNLVSLATNHTIDRGERAVINSCNYWDFAV